MHLKLEIFRSAYLKLTLFYVLVVMIISVSFSVAIYQISSLELGRGLGRQAKILCEPSGDNHSLAPLEVYEKFRLEQLAESGSHLKLNLAYFNLLILLLSSGFSYFLARRTLRPIEEMVAAQNRFTADASHELKTPLTAMRTEIEVNLRDKKTTLAQTKKLLTSNLEEIGKLESLTNALLKLAKNRDDLKLYFKTVSLPEIAVEAYEKVASLADKKSIRFKNHFEKISILGERQSLVELMVILLDNAIKYSGAKSKISIRISKKDKSAVIEVADSGVGIKASELPYIFNRFYRADISRSKEKVDGYGLGLSIAKSIVELHGGEISATSTPGKGSEFRVKLPL